MRRACITGGAGFIGSHLADRLRSDGVEVVIVDDFRTGRREFVEHLRDDPGVTLHEGDVLDQALLERAFEGCDWVFHLQANADVRYGLDHPRRDLEQNTIATATVLEAMRAAGTSKIAFSSTGSVYGEPEVFPTPEDAPFPIQTSLYAASKLAGEGMIGAYCARLRLHRVWSSGSSRSWASVTRTATCSTSTVRSSAIPTRLRVLGDGRQEKSYLYVEDCVERDPDRRT